MIETSLPVVLSLMMGSICNCDTISIISIISIIISSIIMMMIIIIFNGMVGIADGSEADKSRWFVLRHWFAVRGILVLRM